MLAEEYEKIALRLTRVFTPTSPINSDDLFHGRKDQIRAVVDAINQAGQHAILYGERGVGKTSLGQILATKLGSVEPVPIIAPLVTCDSGDDYTSIWSKVFSDITDRMDGYDDNDQSGYELTPHDVRKRILPFTEDAIVYVLLDEFDKVVDDRARVLVADTIKLFSDRSISATLVIIGVSDDVTGLIADHASIERCLAQIHMPRMPRGELNEIVKHGLNKVGMSIDADALAEITGLSKGLPHYTHLLALHSSRHALDAQRLSVSANDVKTAIGTATSQTQESIRDDYDRATYSPRQGTIFRQVLLACAMAAADEFGRFQPTDVCDPIAEILGKPSFTTDRFAGHLKAFCEEDRGDVLEKMGTNYRWRYRFTNPLMQPYVIMKGIATGLVTEQKLKAMIEQDDHYPLFAKKKPTS